MSSWAGGNPAKLGSSFWNHAVPTSARLSGEMLTPVDSSEDETDDPAVLNRTDSGTFSLTTSGYAPPCATPAARVPGSSASANKNSIGDSPAGGGFTVARSLDKGFADFSRPTIPFGGNNGMGLGSNLLNSEGLGFVEQTPAREKAMDQAPKKPTTSQHKEESRFGKVHVPKRRNSNISAIPQTNQLHSLFAQTPKSSGVPLLSSSTSSFQMPVADRPGTPVKKKLFDDSASVSLFAGSFGTNGGAEPPGDGDYEPGKRDRRHQTRATIGAFAPPPAGGCTTLRSDTRSNVGAFGSIPFFVADENDEAEVLCRDLTNLATLETPPVKRRRFEDQ